MLKLGCRTRKSKERALAVCSVSNASPTSSTMTPDASHSARSWCMLHSYRRDGFDSPEPNLSPLSKRDIVMVRPPNVRIF
jgi:hypothetical protein